MDSSNRNQVNIEDEMRRSYLDYAMSVIIGRALPDVRDGLKPVHRRVLWAMHELGNTSNKPYKKSARIVGDCIGKYHPHGDQSVYDALVRLVQEFSMRYPLAAGRATSVRSRRQPRPRCDPRVRLKKGTTRSRRHRKGNGDSSPNYDESLYEPKVIRRYPLCSSRFRRHRRRHGYEDPPQNLTEIIKAYRSLKSRRSLRRMIKIVLAPISDSGFIYGATRSTVHIARAGAALYACPSRHRPHRPR